ncbi:MAG: hypothetical protein K8L99_15395 [Anaerolineae bacterium]|nr:hypothetical protein [Anaerolineae bacterium]
MHRPKIFSIILLIILAALMTVTVSAQDGISVTCDSGASFDNGVEVTVIQMRAGFTYTATAIGIGDFDPILAVLDANGQGLCADNTSDAGSYTVNLPTTGVVPSSRASAQINFSQTSGSNLADVSLVVGSVGNTSGEFVLLLEGMAATTADGSGDPFSVQLTPEMANSGVPVTVYMISVTDALDPLVRLVDADGNPVNDDNGDQIYCDDAGDASLCWGQSSSMSSSYATYKGSQRLGGFGADAMLSLPLTGVQFDSGPRYFNYQMTSYQRSTFGDYVVAIHAGVGSSGSSNTKPPLNTQQATAVPTLPPKDTPNTTASSGISVTCDSGASFDNGVEISVISMRAGFTYTATAIGIGDFDPILAVLDANGQGLCADNTSDAGSYTVSLPTTGVVPSSRNSAQINFNQTSGNNMADVSLVVGSAGNTSGEFVLLLEGMAATSADGTGDPFGVRLTEGMVASGVPLTVYMISVTDDLDPLIARINSDLSYVTDSNGDQVYCDDAGNASLCWGQSSSMTGSYVTRRGSQRLGGFGADAMLSIPLDGVQLDPDPDLRFLNYVMSSFEQSTFGDYVLAFHIGIG